MASHKVDALVDEILKMKQITNGSFEKMIRENIETIKAYQELLDGKHTLTLYTIIRHILYFCDKSSFAHILYDNQRNSFDSWLEKQNQTS